MYYGEGLRFVASVVDQRAEITTLVICPPLLPQPFASRLIERLRRQGTPILQVSAAALASLSLLDHPQGIGAVVRQRWESLDALPPGDELCWLVLELIQSPGNLGTMLRTSQAVGGAGVILVGDGCDPYDPRVIRAGMGASLGQRYVRTTLAALTRWKREHGYTFVGTSPSGPVEYHYVPYRAPTVVLVGWERKGLSRELQRLCDVLVRVPMVGPGDSLNVGAATALVLYELFHQRQGRPPANCVPAMHAGKE